MNDAWDNSQYLSVPETAALLDMRHSDVRTAIKERRILAIRGDDKITRIPRRQFGAGELAQINTHLRGTLTVLADASIPEDEQWEWLLTPLPELGDTPLAALEKGNIRGVRRAALVAGV